MYNLNGNENEMNTASPNEITTTERRILGAGAGWMPVMLTSFGCFVDCWLDSSFHLLIGF